MILLFPSRNSDGSRAREKLDVEKHDLADKVFFLKQIGVTLGQYLGP